MDTRRAIIGAAVWSAAMVLAEPAKPPPSRFAMQLLPANEVQVDGWLKVQAQEDLHAGLPGRLADIMPEVASGMFARQDAGFKPGRPSWWPGEQEGYWHEGLIHLAFLADDADAIRRATDYVEAILASQGSDGYIGIYAPGSRLLPVDDPRYGDQGGELHTQAHAFLAMLAFYEHTGRADLLAAVERAAQLTMKTYEKGVFGTAGKAFFKAGGNSHTVTFADPMVQLYRLTGNEDYLAFVGNMYTDYNLNTPRDRDLTRAVLNDPAALFTGHGAHTAESFHMVQAAALAGAADPSLPVLAMDKLQRHLTPGGAMVSGEMIDGHIGNGRHLYEHCTQAELIKSFAFLTQYTADPAMAERAARLFFNGVQGARLHPCAALQYLSRDDRLDIPSDPAKEASSIRNEGSHFQMSSIIRPACCPASTGRPLPYYVASSWMKATDGKTLAAMNFAPGRVATTMAGTAVRIEEQTEYPFGDRVVLVLDPAKAVAFDLALRLPPEGDIKVVSDGGATQSRRNGLLVFSKTWQKGDRIEIKLDLPVVLETTQDGTAQYYRRGALVFGIPFKSEVKTVSENPRSADGQPSGLFEYDIRVADAAEWGRRIDPSATFAPVELPGDPLHPFEKPTLGLKGTLLAADGKPVPVVMVSMGAAVSRRVTFLDASRSAEEAAKLPEESKIGIGY